MNYKKEVIQASREQFGTVRAKIEAAIIEELAVDLNATMPEPKPKPAYGPKRTNTNSSPVTTGSTFPRSVEQTERPREIPRSTVSIEDKPAPPPRHETPVRHVDHEQKERSIPAPAAKTSEDLKSILRAMAAKNENKPIGATKLASTTHPSRNILPSHIKAQTQKSEPVPLKSVLADVLRKAEAERKPKSEPLATPSKKPFEVPEETLKAIFKEQ